MTSPIFENKLVILGYGTIAKAVLPLLQEYIAIQPENILIIADQIATDGPAEKLGLETREVTLNKKNLTQVLESVSKPGDFILNLTAGVSSIDLIRFCSQTERLYLDTCIELWPDEMNPDSKTYDERQLLLDLQKELKGCKTTNLSSMGANPGIVSLLTKRLIASIGLNQKIIDGIPSTQTAWAELARDLGVRVIHVNERDTQYTGETFSSNTFASTWSVEAMILESIESAEMALGSHEPEPPEKAVFASDKKREIYFNAPGKDVRIKTWLPKAGEQTGMILNHNEPYSIAELYSIESANEQYWPTVCFVYHPSDQTMESLRHLTEDNYLDKEGHLMLHDIEGGIDELGVLVITEELGTHWLGSQLDIHSARELNAESTATSLQVAAGVLAGVQWVIHNPQEGILEPEDINDFNSVLNAAEKYWGGYIQEQTNWKPIESDLSFKNFLPD